MQRIVFIVVLLFVAWKVLAVWGKRLTSKGAGAEDFSRFSVKSRDRRRRMKEQQQDQAQELVACTRCGTHIPANRVVMSAAGQACCSSDCASQERVAERRRS